MKIKFNPFLQEVRGKIGKTVFRLCHTGEWQIAKRPDMSKVKWSDAQKAHRERFGDASRYAKACMKIPELRAFYLEMAHKRGTRRPFDEAVRHHFQGHDLILEGYLDDIRTKQQNCASSSGLEHPASDPAPESSPQHKNKTVHKPNQEQQTVLPSSPVMAAAPSAGPADLDDRRTFTPLVKSNTWKDESNFYYVSTMCLVTATTAVRLPAEMPV